jgi:chromosome segregation ATPase
MFQVSNEFVKGLTDKIADLEAKLAESEKENRDLEDDHNKLIDQYNKQYNDLCKEINVHSSARERFVKKVKELEQQLAEKDKAIENWQTMYQSVMQSSHNGIEEDKRLIEQLAEKEKEIESLATDLQEALTLIKEGRELVGLNNKVLEHSHQDKISFCIEQFEKLKEKVICGVLDTSNDFWDFTLKKGDAYILDDALLDLLEQEFDNQIEALTHQEDKGE